MKICRAVVFLCMLIVVQAQGDWEKLWRALIKDATGNTVIESGRLYSGHFYRARCNFTIIDADGITDNFSDSDNISLSIDGTDLVYTGKRAGLTPFAEANRRKIYGAIFRRDPAGEISGTTDSQNNQQQFQEKLVLDGNNHKGAESKNNLGKAPAAEFSFNIFSTRTEISFLTVGEQEEDVFSVMATPSYGYSFGEYLEHRVGIVIPVRYSKKDDPLQSESLTATFAPFIRYRIYEADSLFVEADTFSYDIGVHAILHSIFLRSDVFDGTGYLRYGGSIFTAIEWRPFDYLDFRMGISYHISKSDIPGFISDTLVSDDFEWLVETIKDAPLDHELAVGLRVSLTVFEELVCSLEYVRNHSLGEGVTSGNAYLSQVSFSVDYLLAGFFSVDIGYRTAFELDDFEEHTILLGGQVDL